MLSQNTLPFGMVNILTSKSRTSGSKVFITSRYQRVPRIFPWWLDALPFLYPWAAQLLVNSVYMRMNAHEQTLGSISACHDPLLTRYSDLFIRASSIHRPLPSHFSSFHKLRFVQDLSILGIGCLGCLSGLYHLVVMQTVISLVPPAVLITC